MKTQDVILEATRRLVKAYDPLEIYVFGPYAWGVPDEESDLELAVIVDAAIENVYKRQVAGHRVLADLEVSKDIIVYTKHEFEEAKIHPSSLANKIESRGLRVYTSDL